MGDWARFSLVVVVVPLIAVLIWVLNEQEAGRRRRKFLQRYEQRSVDGIHTRVGKERATEKTHVMPRIEQGPLAPDPLQDGQFSGYLPEPKHARRYVRQQL
jgi:hypothetical protein